MSLTPLSASDSAEPKPALPARDGGGEVERLEADVHRHAALRVARAAARRPAAAGAAMACA